MDIKINIDNVDETLTSTQGVFLDFKASWCGPCKMITPLIDQLITEYQTTNPENVLIQKIDIDEDPELAQKFNVRSVPTLVFIKNGEEVNRIVGAVPKSTIKTNIDNLLS